MSSYSYPVNGGGGSDYFGDAVANVAALPPAGAVVGEVRLVLDVDAFYEWNGATWQQITSTNFGDVVGPASSTDNAVARFDSTTGKLLQNSVVTVGDTGNMAGVANLNVSGTTTLAAALTGPLKAASGVVSASAVNLTSEVTGVLPVANGGTNSNAALNNNRVMQSSGGAVVEAAAITASRALISDSNGIPTHATTTSTEIGYVNGVTSSIQTQLDGKQATGNYITALTSDVTASGPGSAAATIAAGAVSLAKMANLAANSIIGNNTGSPATPLALTATQTTAMLNNFVGDSGAGGTKGLVPAPASGDAGKFLTGAGVFADMPTTNGEINLINNPNAANSIGGWVATGAGITVARTTTTTDLPLGPYVPTAIKLTPVSGTTDYVHFRFTVPAALKNRFLKLQFEQRPLSGYATGNVKVDVYTNTASDYSGTATRVPLTTDTSSVTGLGNTTGTFTTSFFTDDLDYYELRFYRVSGTTAINITDVICGTGIQPQGTVITDWINFTPTGSWSTNTTYTGRYRRVGSSVDVDMLILTSGAPTAATLTVNMPVGVTIDVGALSDGGNTNNDALGLVAILDNGTTVFTGRVRYNGTSSLGIDVNLASGTYVERANVTATVPMTFASNDRIFIRYQVPVSNWAGNGIVNLAANNIEYLNNGSMTDADNTTTFTYFARGSALPTVTYTANRRKRIRCLTPLQANEALYFQVDLNNTAQFQTVAAFTYAADNNATTLQQYTVEDTLAYGMGKITEVTGSRTDFDVWFAQYRCRSSTTYGAAGANWTSTSARWRVVKCAVNSAVPFGMSTATTPGLNYLPIAAQRTLTQSADFTAMDNSLYLVDTSAARNVTLPDPATNMCVVIKDKTGTASTNNITLVRPGSQNIEGVAASYVLNSDFGSWTIVSDGTDYWVL